MDFRRIPVRDNVFTSFLKKQEELFYKKYAQIHITDKFWEVRNLIDEWLENVQTTSNIEEIQKILDYGKIVLNYIRSEENCIADLNVIIYHVCTRYVSDVNDINWYNCLITKDAYIIVRKYVSNWKETMKERSSVFFNIKWSYYEKTYPQLEKLRLEKQRLLLEKQRLLLEKKQANREAKHQRKEAKLARRKARLVDRAEARSEVVDCMEDIISSILTSLQV